jgi:hypothetical protein
LQLPEATFSWVLGLEILEHLDAALAAGLLTQLRRAAAAHGTLLLTTPNYRGTWPLVEWLADRSGKVAHLQGDQHVSKFSRGRLRAAVRQAGWRIEQEGTYCTFAPLAALGGQRLADRVGEWELNAKLPFGNLLYLLASAP